MSQPETPNSSDDQATSNAVQSMQDIVGSVNAMDQLPTDNGSSNATKIAHQIAAMNRQLADAHIQNTIEDVRESAQKYQTAVQLQKTGEHISTVQNELIQRNKKVLANLSADTMTAKRVATINQQNSMQARVTTEYLHLCSTFVGVAIVIICLFTLAPVRSFFKHSFAVMQILLAVLFGILLLVIVIRLIANQNHYQMLYQERVFPNYDNHNYKISASQCPVSEDEYDEEDDVETQGQCSTSEEPTDALTG